jgi:hypothetical protein
MRFRRRYQVVVQGESGSATAQRSVLSEHRSERDAREAAAQERRRLEVIRQEEAASWVISVMRRDEVIHEERPFEGRRDAVPVPPVEAVRILQYEHDQGEDAEDDAAESGGAPAGDVTADADPPPEVAEDDSSPEVAAEDDEDDGATGRILLDREPPAGAPGEPEDASERMPPPSGVRMPDDIRGPDQTPLPEFLGGPPHAAADEPPLAARSADADDRAETSPRPETGETPPPPSRSYDPGLIPSGPVPDDVIRRFEEAIARQSAREREREGREHNR